METLINSTYILFFFFFLLQCKKCITCVWYMYVLYRCQEKSYPGEIVPKRNRTQIEWVRFLQRNCTLGTISPEISYPGYDFSRDIVPYFYNVNLFYTVESTLIHCLSLLNIWRLECISHQKSWYRIYLCLKSPTLIEYQRAYKSLMEDTHLFM